MNRTLFRCFLFLACGLMQMGIAHAQELDPRAYQPAPIGINAVILGYTHSSGDVLFDPSFPVKDVQASLNLGSLGYYHTFGLFGRFSNVTFGMPYAEGHLTGTLEDERAQIYRSGLGDLRARISFNLAGTPAAKPADFIKHLKQTNIGISLATSMPTGQYDPNKVINIGQNRWAFKPEVGLSRVSSRWQFDAYAGVWLFMKNDNFLHKTQTQDPIASFQFHLSYNIRPNFWMGVNTNFYSGGRTTLDGVVSPVKQNNSRMGATISLPVATKQSIKVSISRGVLTTRGGNFTSIGTSYNYAW
jgi:hypothetical protein